MTLWMLWMEAVRALRPAPCLQQNTYILVDGSCVNQPLLPR
jgi:hypothetical protein